MESQRSTYLDSSLIPNSAHNSSGKQLVVSHYSSDKAISGEPSGQGQDQSGGSEKAQRLKRSKET